MVIQRSADAPTLLGWDLMSDGSAASILTCEHGGKIFMNGKEVFRRAVLAIEGAATRALERAAVSMDDITLVVPHQANIRIIEAALKRLDIPIEKAAMVLEHTGNTSAASIPLAFVDALGKGRVDPGDLVLCRGRNAMHRVTPTEGSVTRLLVVFALNDRPDVALSDSALQTFYGRTA